MLQNAIAALEEGDLARAREVLARLLRTTQDNPDYWLWMSAATESRKERVFCLRQVLRLDPGNVAARRGLVLLGELTPESVTPVPPERGRSWDVELVLEGEEEKAVEETPARHRRRSGWLVLVAAVVVIGLIGIGLFARTRRRVPFDYIPVTVPPRSMSTLPPTATLLPTNTPVVRTPVPVSTGAPPLASLLEVTYTPTPLLVDTPHPLIEAYFAAMRALRRGQWNEVIIFMQQVIQAETDPTKTADAYFYIGEAHRHLGEYDKAIEAYQQALEVYPDLAAAYLGLAYARRAADPEADVREDLNSAIEADPDFVLAYLERAAWRMEQGDLTGAQQDLDQVTTLQPDHPLLHLYRARLAILQEDYDLALTEARKANELDLTLLPAYAVLGEAYLLNGQPEAAIAPLQTYLQYAPEDTQAQLWLAQAYMDNQQYDQALQSLDEVLEQQPKNADAWHLRGLIHLAAEQVETAVEALERAQQYAPKSFVIVVDLARAYLAMEKPRQAYIVLRDSESLAQTDEERAALYYWRALSLEAFEPKSAVYDWERLLAYPETAVPSDWLEAANAHLLALTPTPAPTPTP